ncbi:hypothetical protein VTO73DRAFT_8901 [Trametes versicolor]
MPQLAKNPRRRPAAHCRPITALPAPVRTGAGYLDIRSVFAVRHPPPAAGRASRFAFVDTTRRDSPREPGREQAVARRLPLGTSAPTVLSALQLLPPPADTVTRRDLRNNNERCTAPGRVPPEGRPRVGVAIANGAHTLATPAPPRRSPSSESPHALADGDPAPPAAHAARVRPGHAPRVPPRPATRHGPCAPAPLAQDPPTRRASRASQERHHARHLPLQLLFGSAKTAPQIRNRVPACSPGPQAPPNHLARAPFQVPSSEPPRRGSPYRCIRTPASARAPSRPHWVRGSAPAVRVRFRPREFGRSFEKARRRPFGSESECGAVAIDDVVDCQICPRVAHTAGLAHLLDGARVRQPWFYDIILHLWWTSTDR